MRKEEYFTGIKRRSFVRDHSSQRTDYGSELRGLTERVPVSTEKTVCVSRCLPGGISGGR